MARPTKFGLDYFPLDVQLDDKFELIEAKYDLTGFGVIIKLLQKIYSNGYYINITEDFLLLFSKRINVNINTVNEIIMYSLKLNLFDQDKYEKYKIITSSGIQKRFIEAISRRKNVTLISQYLVNVDINDINDNINSINTGFSTQSKVKESKVEESKENEILNFVETEIFKNVVSFFSLSEIRNPNDLFLLNRFLNIRNSKGNLEEFIKQFPAYIEYKRISKQATHAFKSFIGDIDNNNDNGGWMSRDWVQELQRLEPKASDTKLNNENPDFFTNNPFL